MVSRISAPVALYLFAGSLVGLIVLFYRLQRCLTAWHCEGWGLVAIIVAGGVFAFASASLIAHCRHSCRTGSKNFRFVLATGCVALALFFLSGEVMIRVLVEETPEGPLLGNTALLPRDWTRVLSHRRTIWEEASREYGVFVTDEVLGWTVGRNRKGVGPFGETYFSNEDGLRVPQNGASLRDRSPALRIAILGDSYTFGEDVSYEDTWGHQLETRLGTDVQVLNFGVPAYGIDQAYLRYLRDVRDWKPDIVILGFISHDVMRSGMVYYWIGFPGAAVPGAKPRFSLAGKQLAPLNLPLPSPEQIHSSPTIGDLPFIESDSAYNSADWKWHLYQYSYVFRFLISWRGNPLSTSYELDADVQQVNEAILKSFIRAVQADDSLPMVVFLPEYSEFLRSSGTLLERELLGRRVAGEAGVEFLDLTPCVESIGSGGRFTTGWHYTPQANGAVARCLQTQIMGADAVTQKLKTITP